MSANPNVIHSSQPTASTGQGGDLARRRFQKGQILFSESRHVWLGRYREDLIRPDGNTVRTRPQVVLGTKKELPTKRLAARKLDEILSRINDYSYQPTRIATVTEFAARWREEVLAKRKPSTVRSANSHLNSHIIPQLGKLRLDQIGPENQQIFINQLAGASRKTVLNVLSTLSSMLTVAKDWGYSCREIDVRKLVLPERSAHVAAHFTRSQVESIFALAQESWRTFFILLAMSGMRAGKPWVCSGKTSTSNGGAFTSGAPRGVAKCNPPRAREARCLSHFRRHSRRFCRNIRQAGSRTRKAFSLSRATAERRHHPTVVEYQLWPILDALGIPRCGLHAFRQTVASFIVDAGYSIEVAQQQLRHSNSRTTLGYTHFRGGVTEQAMADVSNSLKLDAVGRGVNEGDQYIQ